MDGDNFRNIQRQPGWTLDVTQRLKQGASQRQVRRVGLAKSIQVPVMIVMNIEPSVRCAGALR